MKKILTRRFIMKKNRGLRRKLLAPTFVNILIVFTLVAALFPAGILAQNIQSNSIPVTTTQEESFVTSPPSVLPPKSLLGSSPSPTPTPEPTTEINVTQPEASQTSETDNESTSQPTRVILEGGYEDPMNARSIISSTNPLILIW
jgi:hypothetical protein